MYKEQSLVAYLPVTSCTRLLGGGGGGWAGTGLGDELLAAGLHPASPLLRVQRRILSQGRVVDYKK